MQAEPPRDEPAPLSALDFIEGFVARNTFAAQPCPFTGLPQDRPVERVVRW